MSFVFGGILQKRKQRYICKLKIGKLDCICKVKIGIDKLDARGALYLVAFCKNENKGISQIQINTMSNSSYRLLNN